MPLEPLQDAQAVARRAADLVQEAVSARPDAVLLLPAGATPVPLYAELVRRVRAGTLDLGRTHLFQLDELCGVAHDDARGFHAFLVEHLVGPLGLEERFHGLNGKAEDPRTEIERHRAELARLGPPELALLGLGHNGHVAFNEPGSTLDDAARVVQLDAPTRRAMERSFPQGAPSSGMTLGLAEIGAARTVVLLVTGSGKSETLARVLTEAPSSTLPASQLVSHPRFVALADEAAAAQTARNGN